MHNLPITDILKPARLAATLMLSSALVMGWGAATAALAQTEQSQSRAFSIPSQPLPQAIASFIRQTGWEVGYAPASASGKRSAVVQGTMTPRQALGALLAGTGLSVNMTGPETAAIIAPATSGAAIPGAIVLDPVMISVGGGGFSDQSSYEYAGSVEHISRNVLDRRAGTSIGDMFRTTPGVIASDQRNSPSVDVNIRGVQGMNRNQVRVDGSISSIPNYRGYYGVSNRTYVDPDLIAGVDVNKAPGTDAYGAGVIGGSVNMRTLEAGDILLPGRDHGFRLTLGAGTNSVSPPPERSLDKRLGAPSLFDFGSFNGSLAYAHRFDQLELVVAASKRRQGNYFTGRHGDEFITNTNWITGEDETVEITQVPKDSEAVNTQRDVFSALFKLRGEWGDGHRAQLGYMRYDSTFGEVMPSQVGRFGWDSVEQQEPNWAKMDRISLTYGWRPQGNDLIDLNASIWMTDMDHATRTGQALVWDPDANFRALFPIKSTWLGAEISNTSRWNTTHGPVSLTAGLSFTSEDSDPQRRDSYYLPPDGKRWERSGFAQAEWQPDDATTLRGGVRYTNFSTVDRANQDYMAPRIDGFCDFYGFCQTRLEGSGWTKNLGLSYKATPEITVYANYDEGYRGPSLTEAATRYDWLPNPYVQPERSKNVEIGMNYIGQDVLRDNDRLMFKAAYFRNTIKDYIIRQTHAVHPITGQEFGPHAYLGSFLPMNIDRARFNGVELSGSYDAGRWFMNVGATYYTRYSFCGVYNSASNYDPLEYNPGCIDHTLRDDYSANQVPPRFSGNVTLGGRFLDEKLTLGTTVTHIGKRAASSGSNTMGVFMPLRQWNPYTTVDLFASYDLDERTTVSFNAENVTNRFYIDALGLAALPAPGRTISMSLQSKF